MAARRGSAAASSNDGETDDEFGAPPAGDTASTPPGAEDAPEGSAGDSGAADDSEAVKEAQEAAKTAEEERDEARKWSGDTLKKLAEALGIPEEGEGVDIYDIPDDIVAQAVEAISTREEPSPEGAQSEGKSVAATAVRVAIYEQDGAGVALRKWGLTVPLAQANPAAVAESVKRTVEEIVAVPVGPVQAFEPEPIED